MANENNHGRMNSRERPAAQPDADAQTDFEAAKKQARTEMDRETLDAGQIAEAFTAARRQGGVPKHAAQYIKLSRKDNAALAAAYVSHMFGDLAGEADKARRTNSEFARRRDAIQDYVGRHGNDGSSFAQQWQHFGGQDPFQQAQMEKKARLLVSRLYIVYSDPTDASKKGNLQKYIEKLYGGLEGEDVVNLMCDVAQFAAGNIFDKHKVADFNRTLAEYQEKYIANINTKLAAGPNGEKEREEAQKNIQAISNRFEDVLKLIEDNREKRRKDRKADSEYLLREIISDENALIFHMGGGFLIRHSSGKFTCVGGTREEWGQMAMMAMKYIQDRGDPWRALVEIDGSPEFRNYIRAVFRQNSIRMAETGHTEAFLLSEIMKDVIQDYRYNLGRGYAVVRTIKCNKDGKPIYLKNEDGTDRIVRMYQTVDGKWVVPGFNGVDLADPKAKDMYTGRSKDVPVPETVEKLAWDKHKTAQTDTPEPMGPAYNCEVNKYGLKLPTEHNNSFVKAWAMGGDTGEYCLCGSFTPEDPDTGTIPDETIHEMRLINPKNIACGGDFSFEDICTVAHALDRNQAGNDPAAYMSRLTERLAKQARGSNDNIANALGAGDFISDPNNAIKKVEQRDFDGNGDKAASKQNDQGTFNARKTEAAQKAANINVDAGGMAMGF